jgi:hypothetical protein
LLRLEVERSHSGGARREPPPASEGLQGDRTDLYPTVRRPVIGRRQAPRPLSGDLQANLPGPPPDRRVRLLSPHPPRVACLRKWGSDWIRFLRYVRGWHPSGGPSFLIMDNLSAHLTPEARREADNLWIRFVPIPTSTMHLNLVVTHLCSIRRIELAESNFPTGGHWGVRSRKRCASSKQVAVRPFRRSNGVCGCGTRPSPLSATVWA